VIRLIIFLNIVVFCLWQLRDASSIPWLTTEFMYTNFLVSWDSLAAGRWWTLIGTVFSHKDFWHVFVNMFVLSNFGGVLVRSMGTARFVKFYFLAGIIASLSHAVVSNLVMGDPSLPALGASGAVAGCVMLFCFMYPREKILIFFVLPLPAFFGALAFIALDIWGLMAQVGGGGLPIGHGAHLGGSFTGLAWYFLVMRPMLKRRPGRLQN
jgi:membrane associated rhomboid family serine protease